VLTPFVERYLTVDRPRLLTRCKQPTDAVWLSRKGGPLGQPGVALTFKRIGQKMLGYPINPHGVRHLQATRILDDDPRAQTTASLALAHSDPSTVSQFYDQSGSKAAQAVWLQLLADLPGGTSARDTGSGIG
jgi:site-specific recombinase XerD